MGNFVVTVIRDGKRCTYGVFSTDAWARAWAIDNVKTDEVFYVTPLLEPKE